MRPANRFLALSTLFVLATAAAQNRTPDPAMLHALELQQAGDLDGAILQYREFLKTHPAVLDARINMGVALAKQGHFEEAIREYDFVLQREPNNANALLDVALAYYKMNQVAPAVAPLDKLHQLQPGNPQVLLLLADSELRLGHNQRTIELLQPFEAQAGDNLAIAYLLGTALIRDKRVDEGQKLVDQILRNGESAEARLMIGTAKLAAHDFAGARVDLEKAVELNPNLPEVHGYYAAALLSTGDKEGAVKQFHEELKSNPNNYDANLNLGSMLRDDQELEQALPYFRRALEARPGDPATRYQIALVLLSQQKTDEARANLESIVSSAPNFLEAHVSLATAYYKLKRRADGDRERAIVQTMNAEIQAKQPGAVTAK